MGVGTLLLGMFSLAILTSWVFAPIVIIALIVVLIAALLRYWSSESHYLIWNLAEAALRGIPIVKAARAFASERGGRLGAAARRLADYLDAAMPLSLALVRSRLWVAPDVVLAAEVGERTGTLGPSLKKSVEQSDNFRRAIGSIAVKFLYVSLIAGAMFIIVTFMMISIVPVFEEMFQEFGMELPSVTVLLIQLCRIVVDYWYLLMPLGMLMVVVVVIGLLSYIGVGIRSLPVVRMLCRRVDSATVLHSLAIAVEQKQTIPDSLLLLADAIRVPAARQRLDLAAEQIAEGIHWCSALEQAGFITSAQRNVLATAERAGNLAWALEEMADSTIRRAAQRSRAVLSVLFPLLVVGFGFSVLVVAVGMLAPLFNLISALT